MSQEPEREVVELNEVIPHPDNPNLVLVRSGTLSFDDLTNLVADFLSSFFKDVAADATVDLAWRVVPDETDEDKVGSLRVGFKVYKDARALAPGNHPVNAELRAVAQKVLDANPEVVAAVKSGQNGMINKLVGDVSHALHQHTKKFDPHMAFEFVVGLLGLTFDQAPVTVEKT